MSQPLDPLAIKAWSAWVGRSQEQREVLCQEALGRYAAAVGSDMDVAVHFPPLGHWAFFLPRTERSALGEDGHPARGGFLPPISLPRRMFASAEMELLRPLELGVQTVLTSTVTDVRHRQARSGDLVFVEVERRIAQAVDCLIERQTLVYRGLSSPVPTPAPGIVAAREGDEMWRPDSVDLFRFSAATFNCHRIHYDLDYARSAEGYPQLVVHGPFTAAKLYAFATRELGRAPSRFSFRATAPLFLGAPVRLGQGESEADIVAQRCDGEIAMTARFEP